MSIAGLWDSVYFLKQGKFVKIGHTTVTLERRIKSYVTHSLEETVLLGFTHGSIDIERKYHARFSSLRERGEWFRHEGELARFIAEDLPGHQARSERLRMDELRRYMSGAMQKVPPKLPRPVEKAAKKPGRKLVSRGGKVFNTKGKRVLAIKAGDYFVEA